MTKVIFYLFLIIALVVVGAFLLLGKTPDVNGNVVNGGADTGGNYQKVTLSTKNLNYYPNTVTVKANEPVRIYLDESVTGCLRSFTISQLGVAKYLKTPNDYLEFTPKKLGTYRFACSMGMGTGTLIVE